jgi:hypothetical protein
MTEGEFFLRAANWLREEGYLVGNVFDVELEDDATYLHFDFTDEDGHQYGCFRFEGSLTELEDKVEPYED